MLRFFTGSNFTFFNLALELDDFFAFLAAMVSSVRLGRLRVVKLCTQAHSGYMQITRQRQIQNALAGWSLQCLGCKSLPQIRLPGERSFC